MTIGQRNIALEVNRLHAGYGVPKDVLLSLVKRGFEEGQNETLRLMSDKVEVTGVRKWLQS